MGTLITILLFVSLGLLFLYIGYYAFCITVLFGSLLWKIFFKTNRGDE